MGTRAKNGGPVTPKEAAIRARRRTAALAAPLVATASLWGAGCSQTDVTYNPMPPATPKSQTTAGSTPSSVIGNPPAPTATGGAASSTPAATSGQ